MLVWQVSLVYLYNCLIALLEVVENPPSREFQIRVFDEFGSARASVGMPVGNPSIYRAWKPSIGNTYTAKHLSLKSMARSDRITSGGMGGDFPS
jgi:hypothetical protein